MWSLRNQLQGNLPTFDILSELEAAVAIVDAKTPYYEAKSTFYSVYQVPCCCLESTNYYDSIQYNTIQYGLFNRVKFRQATYGLEIATYSVGILGIFLVIFIYFTHNYIT